jgi:hypothetical protein
LRQASFLGGLGEASLAGNRDEREKVIYIVAASELSTDFAKSSGSEKMRRREPNCASST